MIAEAIVRIARRSPKPILCYFMRIIDVSSGVRYLQEHGVPDWTFDVRCSMFNTFTAQAKRSFTRTISHER